MKRADRQVRNERRDGARLSFIAKCVSDEELAKLNLLNPRARGPSQRLHFLIDCLSNAELHRLGLMGQHDPRPRKSALLKRIDRKMQTFERADRRLRRTPEPVPADEQMMQCQKCHNIWSGAWRTVCLLCRSSTYVRKIRYIDNAGTFVTA